MKHFGGGMGSHKHAISGYSPSNPSVNMYIARMLNREVPKKKKGEFYPSIQELMKKARGGKK